MLLISLWVWGASRRICIYIYIYILCILQVYVRHPESLCWLGTSLSRLHQLAHTCPFWLGFAVGGFGASEAALETCHAMQPKCSRYRNLGWSQDGECYSRGLALTCLPSAPNPPFLETCAACASGCKLITASKTHSPEFQAETCRPWTLQTFEGPRVEAVCKKI